MTSTAIRIKEELSHSAPLWYKDAIIYELHIRAFLDSNGDGIGDFAGLIEKLDYLHDLGITALWILPFFPSPLKDDGYDIADYTDVNPIYGNMDLFKKFLDEAHRRGIYVICELVLNHTSDQHPWFQKARRGDPKYRDYYVWSDSPDRYNEARIIFQDFEPSNWTWDPIANAYYWHRFYSQQPDLNYDNPEVRGAMLQVLNFWFDLGVDGVRLDAVPYLFEREGSNCENLAETHEFLRAIRKHVDENYDNRVLLAEANQWPDDAMKYFGDGDECHMCFHFPLMPRMFMALRMENSHPLTDIIDQLPAIPKNSQWVTFLRNHDELTLEMVTDEERDYMYRMYAQDEQARINLGIRRRLASLLQNNRRQIELLNALLFSLPGTPVIYYGDEIGMGDNIYLGDRDGVRTPFHWSADRNAGFSKANPHKLYLPVIQDSEYHYATVNVEAQQTNPNSLLWFMKRLIALRKENAPLTRGELEIIHSPNARIFCFTRTFDGETILVVSNLSRNVQYTELDLSKYRGSVPVEMFGKTEFPPIGELPYLLTLPPHSFYWFALSQRDVYKDDDVHLIPEISIPSLASWAAILDTDLRRKFERALPYFLQHARWYSGAQKLLGVEVVDHAPVPFGEKIGYLLILKVHYVSGETEYFQLPITLAREDRAEQIRRDNPKLIVCDLVDNQGIHGSIHDAMTEEGFNLSLLNLFATEGAIASRNGVIAAVSSPGFSSEIRGFTAGDIVNTKVLAKEQSNTSVIYGQEFILKLIRRIEEGTNLDYEVGRYLTEQNLSCIAQPKGMVTYLARGLKEPITLMVSHLYVPNHGNAWDYTLGSLSSFFQAALAFPLDSLQTDGSDDVVATPADLNEATRQLISPFLFDVTILAERTADLHLALGAPTDRKEFRPEPVTELYQRSLYQSLRSQVNTVCNKLASNLSRLSEEAKDEAKRLLGERNDFNHLLKIIYRGKIPGKRIRVHGDYHLGQVLYTGNDFVIIDFEGEPDRPLSERKIRRSPFKDVAGMVRSFDYAAHSAILQKYVSLEDQRKLQPWTQTWVRLVTEHYLNTYYEACQGADLIPKSENERTLLLVCFLIEKAIYEVGYELSHRPDWTIIPLKALRSLLRTLRQING
jgi:maltose alpha-D-glucosyltransferase/alpha-amylase